VRSGVCSKPSWHSGRPRAFLHQGATIEEPSRLRVKRDRCWGGAASLGLFSRLGMCSISRSSVVCVRVASRGLVVSAGHGARSEVSELQDPGFTLGACQVGSPLRPGHADSTLYRDRSQAELCLLWAAFPVVPWCQVTLPPVGALNRLKARSLSAVCPTPRDSWLRCFGRLRGRRERVTSWPSSWGGPRGATTGRSR
jgi:hypothetical protein